MAIIYSYPVVAPTADDLLLGTDSGGAGKPTKNFTVQSIVDIVSGGAAGLGAVLKINSSAKDPAAPFANQSATNFLNISGTGSVSFNSFTDGTISITGGVGTGFTSITSTEFAGNLTGIVKAGSSIQSTVTGVTQPVGTNNTTLATTAFVMSKVDPSVLTFVGTNGGNQTVNLAAQTFSVLGTANQIETDGTAQTLTIKFPTAGVILPDGSTATTQAATDDSTKIATTAFVRDYDDIQTLDFTDGTTASTVLLNSQTLTLEGTADQVTTTVSAQKVKFSLPTNVAIAGIFTGVTFSGDLNGTVNTATTGVTQTAGDNSTKIATTAYVDSASGSKTLSYKDTSATVNTMNLTDDDLQFTGGSNITSTATAVATNIADIKFDLNNSVTISGTMKADTFTTTAGTATWVTTVLDGFTAITSDLFTGPLTGNASTASALFDAGTINMTSTAGATLGPTASAVTYTDGGNISLSSVLLASTVTSKLLTGISFSTGTTVAQTDTILQGIGKLQKQITDLPSGLDYIGTWSAAANGSNTGGTPDLTQASLQVPGQYYIVATAGDARPNGAATEPNEWKVGDWAIFSDAPNSRWEKIDNTSEVTTDGSGVAGTMPVWNNASELGSSQVQQSVVSSRTVTTIVDGGTGGDLTVQGNTLLGSASTDTINSVGVHTIDNQLILKKGLGLGATPDYGDSVEKVLMSGNGSANPPTWVNRSTWGYVESVSGGAGIVLTGDAVDPIVNVDYLGTDNIILSAGAAVTPVGADTIIINDATTGNVVKALISNLPFNSYSWDLNVDSGTAVTISNGEEVDFLSGTGIIQSLSTRDVTTALRYSDVNNDPSTGALNFIDASTTATPVASDFLIFSDQETVNFKTIVKKATIADIIDLGNETLSQVLSNGNTSGANDVVMADNQKVTFGTVPDLQIYHDATGGNSHIQTTSGSAGDLLIESQGTGHDLYLRATDDIFIQPQGSENGIKVIGDGAVELYHNAVKKLETTSAGIEITGSKIVIDSGAAGNSEHGTIIADATYGLRLRGSVSGTNSEKGGIYVQQSVVKFPGEVIGVSSPNPDITMMQINRTITGSGGNVLTIGDSTSFGLGYKANSVFQGDVDIKGDLSVDGSIIHGGGKSGIFNGSVNYTGTTAAQLFLIKRTTTGQMIFDVFLTSGTAGGSTKKYTVAHKSNTATVYNKIIETTGTPDFTVTFANTTATNTGDAVACTITPTATQTVSYTIQVGFDNANTVVVS